MLKFLNKWINWFKKLRNTAYSLPWVYRDILWKDRTNTVKREEKPMLNKERPDFSCVIVVFKHRPPHSWPIRKLVFQQVPNFYLKSRPAFLKPFIVKKNCSLFSLSNPLQIVIFIKYSKDGFPKNEIKKKTQKHIKQKPFLLSHSIGIKLH